MTIIAGIKHGGKVTLAADSLSCTSDHHTLNRYYEATKVFAITDQLAIATSGSRRMADLLRFQLPDRLFTISSEGRRPYETSGPRVPHTSLEIRRKWLHSTFIETVRKVFGEFGWRAIEENTGERQQAEGGAFLVAYGDLLAEVYSDFQVSEPSGNWAVLGAGYAFAAGALWRIEEECNPEIEPPRRLDYACRAACSLSPYCGGAITLVDTRGVTS